MTFILWFILAKLHNPNNSRILHRPYAQWTAKNKIKTTSVALFPQIQLQYIETLLRKSILLNTFLTMLTQIFLSHVCQVTFSNSSLLLGGGGIEALGFFSLSLGWPLKGSPEGGGGRVCSIIEGGMYMGWGGIGTPLPHPSFISKFMIIFPEINNISRFNQWLHIITVNRIKSCTDSYHLNA